MAILTIQDVQGFIALAIANNKQALINAMNATGNNVAQSISNDDLFTAVNNVFINKGVQTLKIILDKVPIDKSKFTQAQLDDLVKKYLITI